MKVLIIDEVHETLIEKLQENRFQCDYFPEITNEEVGYILSKYDGLILRSKLKVTKEIIERAKNLKFIGRVGAGMENIDTGFAETSGIVCFNSPEGNRDAVAEHALAMLLAVSNNICRANSEVRNFLWKREENRGFEIGGKTIGIIGYGNMGGAFAKRLSGFGCKVIAYDKYKKFFTDDYATEVCLEFLQQTADIISLHVPLTNETSGMADSRFFDRCKNGVVLLNTARGKVVDTQSLADSLKEGKVSFAALDVFEYEESDFEMLKDRKENDAVSYLLSCDRVLFTPHIAGWTYESNVKLSQVLAEKIIGYFNKQKK